MTSSSALVLLIVLVLCGVALRLLASARRVRGRGSPVVVRCLAGHVFTTAWAPVPHRAAGLVQIWLRYCPVGEHWTLVSPVRPEDLTPAQWRLLRHIHD